MDIALVGLPSAGKSSIINSLIGKRMAQSGVSRTTTEVKLYDNLISDDDIKYKIYDLPGIADIEDKDNNFDTLIFDTIRKCNMVIWVSDIIKSFITNHEMKEFEKISNYIKQLGLEEGITIQLIILLSKVDKNLITKEEDYESCIENNDEESDNDELKCDEETTIIDIYKNIQDKFNDIDIICFNAYGRSYYNKKSSSTLKTFVKQFNPNNINTDFNLKKYYDNIPIIHDNTKINYFIEKQFKNLLYKESICDTNNIDMPDNLILWCNQSNCRAIDCNKKNCTDCNIDKYYFACKHTHWILNDREERNGNLPNTTMINGISATHCPSGCRFNFSWFGSKILCKHGYNFKKCKYMQNNIVYLEKITKIFNSLYCENNKLKLIKFILYDINSIHTDLMRIKVEEYNNDSWNMICRFIKIDIKKYYNYLDNYNDLTLNQIYRLIQISNDLDIYDKLYLYSHPNCKTINLSDTKFICKNIYNTYYFISGNVFILKTINENRYINFKYSKEIYKTSILKQIKEIRKKVFGDAEDDIDINMIPIAYDKYGLFWNPNQQ